jgi:type III secretion protein Q
MLPCVPPELARVSRVAFDRRLPRWLQGLLGGVPVTVSSRALPSRSMLLELEAGSGRLSVALDSRDWLALDMALDLPDEGDACAVCTLLLAPLLELLDRVLPAPRVVHRRLEAAVGMYPFIATPQAGALLLALDAATQVPLRRALAQVPAGVCIGLPGLRLQPRLRLLRRRFPLTALAAMAPGDIVLLDTTPGTTHTFRLINGKGMTMQTDASYDPGSGEFVATAIPALEQESEERGHQALPLDALQVPVSFEVDTARISLAELASMGPGYVIELEQPLDTATVRLSCHGQTVGRGQLVAVGAQLGVRILDMAMATGAEAP